MGGGRSETRAGECDRRAAECDRRAAEMPSRRGPRDRPSRVYPHRLKGHIVIPLIAVISPMKNVHGNTVDHLGEAIVAGRYATGSAIPPEPRLCEELGVSRTVIRESVKSLVAKGLISTGPKVGTRVLPEDQWNWFDPDVIHWKSKSGLTREFLRDLQDLRRVLEPAAVRMAAERATPRDIAEIESAYAGMVKAVEEGGDYVASDLLFHQGLLRASHNRMIVQMSKVLSALLRTSFEI